jgi:hypothetical protein
VPFHCICCFLLIYLKQGLITCSIKVLELFVYFGRAEADLVVDNGSDVVVFIVCLWEIYGVDVTSNRQEWGLLGHYCVPIQAVEKGMVFDVLDAIRTQALEWLWLQQGFDEAVRFWRYLAVFCSNGWILYVPCQSVSEYLLWRFCVKGQ